jgi:hypothetical protein
MRLVFALLATAACTEPAVEMKLVMPADSADFDMSCVTAVDLVPIAVGDVKSLSVGAREDASMEALPCVDLPHAPTSFVDVENMIRGRFDVALPSAGLGAVEIRGREGSCDENPAYRDAIFYGGATYTAGQDTLAIPVAHNLSCDAAADYTVHPVNMADLFATGQCADVADGASIYAGNVRPSLIEDREPIFFEDGNSFHSIKDGIGTINSYKSSWAGTCPAAQYFSDIAFAVSCINPTAPTACAGPGQLELPFVPDEFALNTDSAVGDDYATWVLVGVWTSTGTPGPMAGATITVDGDSDAQVEYGDATADGFQTATGAAVTTASGMAMVYTNQIAGITVTAPGKASQHVWVGGDPWYQATSLVVVN